MKHLSKLIAAVFASIASGAMAADLRPAPPPVVAPVLNWNGFYVGAHGGYGWADTSGTATSFSPFAILGNSIFRAGSYDLNSEGAVFGGQIGYNWQFAPNWVLGVEGDFSGSSISGFASQSVTLTPAPFGGPTTGGTSFMRQDINWIASLRGRLGYTWGTSMLYVTGGAAWADIDYSGDANPTGITGGCCAFPASFSKTQSGWTIGGGYEYMLASNWTIRGEYLFYRFDGNSGTSAIVSTPLPAFLAGSSATYAFGDIDLHVFRLGVNYKF